MVLITVSYSWVVIAINIQTITFQEEIIMTANSFGSNTDSKVIKIHNSDSRVNTWYDMSAPIQLTLEYCRGISEDDFFSIMMVSPTDTFFHTASINSAFHKFNTRTPHQHSFFELMLVLEGNITQQIEDKDYFYHAGTCCLINQNIVHREKFTGEAKILFIGLSVDFIKDLIESEKNTFFQKEEVVLQNSIFRFIDSNIQTEEGKTYLDFLPVFQNQTSVSELHRLSDLLIHAMLLPKLGSTYMIKGLICQLFQYLDTKDYYHISNVKLNSSSDLLLFSRITHLMEDTNGRMSRSQLERALCYNGNYMNTIVHKHTGMCLYDYGLTFCMKQAKVLLKTTELSVSAIALQLGFTNRTHFYKLFKEKYGITPGEYRQNAVNLKKNP